MKVLVTGSHGFLGRAFVAHLKRTRVPYTVYNRARPHIPPDVDTVVHCAGLTPLSEGLGSAISFRSANVETTRTLLAAVAKSNVRRFVNIGTAAEYGVSSRRLTERSSEHPSSEYGKSKLAQTRLVDSFARRTGIRSITLRIFNVAALPRRAKSKGFQSTIFETLMRFFKSHEETLFVSHEKSERDYVALADVTDAILRAAQTEKGGVHEIVNIASGTGTTIAELAEYFNALFHKPYALASRERLPDRSVGMNAKAQRLLGWRPRVSLRISLRAMARNRPMS